MGRAPVKSTRALLGQRPTVLLPPSNFIEIEQDLSPPHSRLQLEWAYGYNSKAVGSVHWISENEFVFCVAAVGVVQCLKPAKQRIFVGHSQRITCLTYCPTSQLCASGQMDPKGGAGPFICIWRPADCILLSVLAFPIHEDQITSLCISADGMQLFSIARDSANTLALWENVVPRVGSAGATSSAMDLPHIFRTPIAKVATGKVSAFGMAGNGAVAGNFRVAIFDAGRGSIGLLLKFFSVVDGDLHGRAAIFPPNSAPRHVLNCAWSQGKCLACGDNGYLYIFEANSAVCCHRISAEPLGFAVALKSDRNGELLVGSKDSVLHFCHLSGHKLDRVSSVPFSELKGAALLNVAAGPSGPSSAAVGSAGVLIGSENHHLMLLDPVEHRVKLLQLSHRGEVTALAVHPDPTLKLLVTAGAQDATVRFWDINEHQPVVGRVLRLEDAHSGIYSLAFNPSGQLLALGCGDGYLQLVPFPSLTSGSGRKGATERLSALCFTGENTLAAGSWDQTVHIFDTSSNSKSALRQLKGNTSSVTHLQCSAGGDFLMTNSKDGQVLYFNVASGERVTQDTVKDILWSTWSCTMAWHTMGMWAAQRHFGVTGIKSCRAFEADTGEQLLASGDVCHRVKLYHFPCLSGEQGFHCYDGHGGFVSGIATVPAQGSRATHLITLGCDDGAVLQWRFVSCATKTAPQTCAWEDKDRPKQEPMRLREPTAKTKPRQRPPWEHEEVSMTTGRAAAPGPWAQHSGTTLPYAEHMEHHVHRSRRPKGGMAPPSDGPAGAATALLATVQDAQRKHAAAELLGAAGKTSAAKDEHNPRRRKNSQCVEHLWMDSGAIIASVATKVTREQGGS